MPILLIEDDDNDARLLVRALRKAGHKTDIKVLKNAEAAIAYLSAEPPNARPGKRKRNVGLLLLDLSLPGMSGLEFLQWCRANEKLTAIPIVVLSASPYLRDVSRAYELGARTFFPKPTDPLELERIATLILGYWSAASWPALPPKPTLPPRVNPAAADPSVPPSDPPAGTTPETV